MFAMILGSPASTATDDLARPVAGAPLLVRQIEWLQSAGVDHIIINRVADRPLPSELRSAALAATGVRVTWIPTGEAIVEAELALRGGASGDVLIVLSHGTLGNIDLTPWVDAVRSGAKSLCLNSDGGSVRVVGRDSLGGDAETAEHEGWLFAVDSEPIAQALTESLLMGERDGVVIRGTQVTPGIWRARGAVVVEGATLEAPCFLGPNCFIAEGATAGPGAIVGEHAVLESQATLLHGRVDSGVIVGQGVRIANACAMDGRIVRHGGRSVAIDDALLLGRDESPSRLPRLLAAFALGVVAPVSVVAGGPTGVLCRRLARVVDGRGQWLGVREQVDEDAVLVDLMPVLVPPHAEEEERRAAKALYDAKKSRLLDAKLFLGRLFGTTHEEET